jgi:hypothetical protein
MGSSSDWLVMRKSTEGHVCARLSRGEVGRVQTKRARIEGPTRDSALLALSFALPQFLVARKVFDEVVAVEKVGL